MDQPAPFAPRITSVVETHHGRRMLATVTLQVDLIDLEMLLAPCDLSAVEGSGSLAKAREAAAALVAIREAAPRRRLAEPADEPSTATGEPVHDSKAKSGQELLDHVLTERGEQA